MKMFTLVGIFLMTVSISPAAFGEDSSLLLTFTTAGSHGLLKNELRAGLWKSGQDGFNPLDMEAMVNGVFDVYFKPLPDASGSNRLLWWDIRSSNPGQQWTIQIKAPPGQKILLEWKQIPFDLANPSVLYRWVDPETGKVTDLDQGTGTLSFLTTGTKTFILKSYP